MTIKAYIEQLWSLGSPAETIVALAQKKFPHKCAGRTYVLRIVRELMMVSAREAREKGTL